MAFMYLDEERFHYFIQAFGKTSFGIYQSDFGTQNSEATIDSIDDIQKRETKLLLGYYNFCYKDM